MQRALVGMGWVGFATAALLACGGDASTDGTRGRGNAQTLAARSGGGIGGTMQGAPSGGASMWGEPIQPTRGGTGSMKPVQTMDPMKCTTVTLNASRITPNVMLVVDGSSSMVDDPDTGMPAYYPPTQMTTRRWDAVRTALVDPMMGVVPQLQGLVKFGLAVFGTGAIFGGGGMCPLPLGVTAPALNNFPAVMGGLGAAPPGTFTPTGLALNAIVDMLPDGRSLDPDKIVEPQIIILATDGNPNDCMDAMPNFQPSIEAANKAAAKNIKMFVISVGTDTSMMHLQQMANIGAGMPMDMMPGAKVFYPENTAELSATLSELIGKELSCEVKLEGKGVIEGRECEGKVSIDGKELECNGADGWRLNDPLHIEVLGTACETFKKSAQSMLLANFPCEIIVG